MKFFFDLLRILKLNFFVKWGVWSGIFASAFLALIFMVTALQSSIKLSFFEKNTNS